MLYTQDMLNRLTEVVRSERLVHTDIPEEGGVVLDITGQQVLSLNEVGMFLFHQIRGDGETPEQLVRHLVAEFQVDEVTARVDLHDFLGNLARFLGIPD